METVLVVLQNACFHFNNYKGIIIYSNYSAVMPCKNITLAMQD